MEACDNLQRRFPHADVRSIQKAIDDCNGHGGRAANRLQSKLIKNLQKRFHAVDEETILAVLESCEMLECKAAENLDILFNSRMSQEPHNAESGGNDEAQLALAMSLSLHASVVPESTEPLTTLPEEAKQAMSPAASCLKMHATESQSVIPGKGGMIAGDVSTPHEGSSISSATHRLRRLQRVPEFPLSAIPPDVNMGPREPMKTLAAEFRYNEHFQRKVGWLARDGYVGWRRIRGDGNCFYRAVGFALLEQLVKPSFEFAGCSDAHEKQRVERSRSLRRRLLGMRFDERLDVGPLESAAHEELLVRVAALCQPYGCWEDTLAYLHRSSSASSVEERAEDANVGNSSDNLFLSMRLPTNSTSWSTSCNGGDSQDSFPKNLDLALVRAMRQLAANFMRDFRDDERAGGGLSFSVLTKAMFDEGVDTFCDRVVVSMGVEAESLVLTAMAHALGESFRVVYLDPNELTGRERVTFVDYLSDFSIGESYAAAATAADTGAKVPNIHVQLRPGHYDVLYRES
eukprot:TRINITY_DN50583_c0_g1_i1.p1 TRINITY_DN50583_c0_g1~~TRINITY_DN50583_c0_g1_i1.p1  ORF type:complete len:517 (+),score=91.00 TRINITY_DN50583_c0_g1_i1:71-1621(+)